MLQTPASDIAESCHPLFLEYPNSVSAKKLRKRLVREVRAAIDDYGMVRAREGKRPKWLVCLSGGKDSYALLAILLDLTWRGLLPVDLLACNLDQRQPGFPEHVLPEFLARHDIPHHIETRDTYSIVTEMVPAHQTYCALCSRLRRGILYRVAREFECEAVVLGHHADDILETFYLNLFHGGRLEAMPPKLLNDDGDLLVLRPLAYSGESDIEKFSTHMQFPIIPCNLCGSQEGLQRQNIKEMLGRWEAAQPGRKRTMLRALSNVRASHLLDRNLFDFAAIRPGGEDGVAGNARAGGSGHTTSPAGPTSTRESSV